MSNLRIGENAKKGLLAVVLAAVVLGVYSHWFSVSADFREGNELKSQGKIEQAIAAYSKVIERDPKNVEAYIARADCNAKTSQPAAAIEDCKKALEINPDCVEALLLRADTYRTNKEYSSALADYRHVLAKHSKNAQAYLGIARIYKARQEYKSALAAYDKAINYATVDDEGTYKRERDEYANSPRPATVDDWINSGDECYNANNYAEAVSYYTKAINKGEDVYLKRGNAYRFMEEYTLAIADYTKVIEDNKDDQKYSSHINILAKDTPSFNFSNNNYTNSEVARAYFGRGYSYSEQGDLDKAIADYTKAVELSPQYAAAYNNRGVCYGKQGDTGQALANYTKAIEINPKDALYYKNRGKIYQKLGHAAEAEADFAKANELEGK